MKTWEMIKALTENPEKKFKGKILGQAELYEGILVWSSSMEDVVISNTLLKMEWEEVKEPISFIEVLKATKENKGVLITIKNPEYDIYYEKWPLDSLLNELSEHLATDKLSEILLMSEFYID